MTRPSDPEADRFRDPLVLASALLGVLTALDRFAHPEPITPVIGRAMDRLEGLAEGSRELADEINGLADAVLAELTTAAKEAQTR